LREQVPDSEFKRYDPKAAILEIGTLGCDKRRQEAYGSEGAACGGEHSDGGSTGQGKHSFYSNCERSEAPGDSHER
jgi:hypothetical protein